MANADLMAALESEVLDSKAAMAGTITRTVNRNRINISINGRAHGVPVERRWIQGARTPRWVGEKIWSGLTI